MFADQGHNVVALSLTGGPPPPDADPKVRSVRKRLDDIKAAEILKIRLECLNYSGGNMEQFRYGTACEISPQRYKEFTELLLDKHKPDIVFTHWPIDVHMDHRAASLLTYTAWLHGGEKFPRGGVGSTNTKTLLPRIMLISLQWNSARTRRGKHCRCGATQCGPFMTECGKHEEPSAAVKWRKHSTTTLRARHFHRYLDRSLKCV